VIEFSRRGVAGRAKSVITTSKGGIERKIKITLSKSEVEVLADTAGRVRDRSEDEKKRILLLGKGTGGAGTSPSGLQSKPFEIIGLKSRKNLRTHAQL